MADHEESNSTLRDYLRIIFRRKTVILTCVVTATLSVFLGLMLNTPMYEAKVKMLISAEKEIQAPYYRELDRHNKTELALTQSEIVKSKPVIERAIGSFNSYIFPLDYELKFCSPLKAWFIKREIRKTRAKLSSMSLNEKQSFIFRKFVNNLRDRIDVAPIRETQLFTISARDFNPLEAAKIANVISRSYVIFDLQQQLAEARLKYGNKYPLVNQLEDNIARLSKSLNTDYLTDLDAIGPASVKIIEQATVPLKPNGPSKSQTLLLTFVLSAGLGILLSFIFEHLDPTVKGPKEIDNELQLPLMGSIRRKKLINHAFIRNGHLRSAYAKSYQNFADQLYLSFRDKDIKTLLLISPTAYENAGIIVSNLGQCLSQRLDSRVLIIDANVRTPSIHKFFRTDRGAGLAELLSGQASLKEIAQDISENLTVIAAGQEKINPITLFNSPRMRSLIQAAQEEFDLVLIHCVDCEFYNDAYVLSSLVDGIALIVNEGRTRIHAVKNIIPAFRLKKANVLGVILNNRTYPIPKFIYENV